MDKQNLMPTAAQPVNRIATGQLPRELAELSEEALSQQGGAGSVSIASVLPSGTDLICACACSYGDDDGDDAE
ncbi:MAG: DUF5837 family cyanobactin class RiPP [Nostoc sp.]|uniref:DUF5837 family cyanobactin class RiPP n=1 Tax=Nostoc sp. TaxID=1180 RepID=UPI002FF78456